MTVFAFDRMFEIQVDENDIPDWEIVFGGLSMKKLDFYWMSKEDWWDLDNYVPVVRPDAPQEAQDSYKHYLEQCRKFDEIYGKGKWN